MKNMTVYETEKLRRELRMYMDLHHPRRRNYAVKLAQAQRRLQRRTDEGPLGKLMIWLAVRRETNKAMERMAARGY